LGNRDKGDLVIGWGFLIPGDFTRRGSRKLVIRVEILPERFGASRHISEATSGRVLYSTYKGLLDAFRVMMTCSHAQ
jgi:hypothetical protein